MAITCDSLTLPLVSGMKCPNANGNDPSHSKAISFIVGNEFTKVRGDRHDDVLWTLHVCRAHVCRMLLRLLLCQQRATRKAYDR